MVKGMIEKRVQAREIATSVMRKFLKKWVSRKCTEVVDRIYTR